MKFVEVKVSKILACSKIKLVALLAEEKSWDQFFLSLFLVPQYHNSCEIDFDNTYEVSLVKVLFNKFCRRQFHNCFLQLWKNGRRDNTHAWILIS